LSSIQAAVAAGAEEFKSYRIVTAIAIAIDVINLAWILAFLWLHAEIKRFPIMSYSHVD